MKSKFAGFILSAAALLTTIGCDDNTGSIGIGLLPDTDGLTTHTDMLDIWTKSVRVDSVFARTSTGYVGHYTDPNSKNGFGRYEASFLTELNCVDDFTFPEVYTEYYKDNALRGKGIMAGDTVSAIQLTVYYSTWFGDSLNACRMSAYTLDKKLERNRYTNLNPEEYYKTSYGDDVTKFVAHKAFSAYDTSVSDSLRNATDDYGNKIYYPNVTFPLSKKFGQYILDANRQHPEYFHTATDFINNVFKGVYIKNTYGDGTIIYVDRVDLQMQFRFHVVNDTTGVKLTRKDQKHLGEDSLYYKMVTVFASTKEVVQANKLLNSNDIEARVEEKTHTYLKSPAGIFTEATIPYDRFATDYAGDTLNAVKLTFTGYRRDNNYKFDMGTPNTVLLIRRKDVKSFFEENKVADNITTFTATLSSNQYTFNNIARLISSCLNEKAVAMKKSDWNEAQWEEENKILLIPVSITIDSNTQSVTGVQNDLTPGYSKLKGGTDPLTMQIIYTTFNR
ncbi:MAG: DUF4270 domain-containing protein [Prevotellaceae bacterium]|jgi:hypothetical protein|nr:DUF4270 domain-containing protein [Prevotellaceae bacterium]